MSRLRTLAVAGLTVALAGLGVTAATGTTTTGTTTAASHRTRPTVVLVHGAFADASGWSAEIRYLSAHGYPVIAPANPLRGLDSDAAYIHGVLAAIDGPVVLVGHSYGGAVIASAAHDAPNVKALVYISAFIPENHTPPAHYIDPAFFPGSLLNQDTLLIRPTYNAITRKDDKDVYIAPEAFHAVFAGDQSVTEAAVLAAEQRPLTASAFYAEAGPAAALPSWDLVSLEDRAIPPSAQLHMAKAAGAHVTEVHSAHDSLITHPRAVDALIVAAARATS